MSRAGKYQTKRRGSFGGGSGSTTTMRARSKSSGDCVSTRDPSLISTDIEPLDVSCHGVLYKRSMKGDAWQKRHCILKSGIFCYFRTQSKLNSFRENIECIDYTSTATSTMAETLPLDAQSSPVSMSRQTFLVDSPSRMTTHTDDTILPYIPSSQQHKQHSIPNASKRKAFRKALQKYPPRGFIKLLNGQGKPVSRVWINEDIFYVTHLESQRTFELKCDDPLSSERWRIAFTQIQIVDINGKDGDESSNGGKQGTELNSGTVTDGSSAAISGTADGKSSSAMLSSRNEVGGSFGYDSNATTGEPSEAAADIDENKMKKLEADEERMRETADALKREAEQSMSKLTEEFSQWLA